mgnify:CR=1 FL=1
MDKQQEHAKNIKHLHKYLSIEIESNEVGDGTIGHFIE